MSNFEKTIEEKANGKYGELFCHLLTHINLTEIDDEKVLYAQINTIDFPYIEENINEIKTIFNEGWSTDLLNNERVNMWANMLSYVWMSDDHSGFIFHISQEWMDIFLDLGMKNIVYILIEYCGMRVEDLATKCEVEKNSDGTVIDLLSHKNGSKLN